jgi:hypothetical protein
MLVEGRRVAPRPLSSADPGRSAFGREHHLECVGLTRSGERVIRLDRFLQREEVGGEPGRIDCPAATLATLFAGWGSKGIHQAGRDGDALDLQRLQVQRRRLRCIPTSAARHLDGSTRCTARRSAGCQPPPRPRRRPARRSAGRSRHGPAWGVVAKLAPNFWAVTPSGVGSIATIAEGEYSGVPGSRPARPSRLHHPQRRGLRCPGP